MGSLMNKKGLFHKIQAYIKPRILGEWPLFDMPFTLISSTCCLLDGTAHHNCGFIYRVTFDPVHSVIFIVILPDLLIFLYTITVIANF